MARHPRMEDFTLYEPIGSVSGGSLWLRRGSVTVAPKGRSWQATVASATVLRSASIAQSSHGGIRTIRGRQQGGAREDSAIMCIPLGTERRARTTTVTIVARTQNGTSGALAASKHTGRRATWATPRTGSEGHRRRNSSLRRRVWHDQTVRSRHLKHLPTL